MFGVMAHTIPETPFSECLTPGLSSAVGRGHEKARPVVMPGGLCAEV